MKKIHVLSFLLMLAMFAACGKAASESAAKPLKNEDLDNQKKKVSYAIGLDIGKNFKERAMDLDMEILIQGLRDAQGGA
ncbi:MAG TPA: FKBP-type peptidyl-prolyl cis-trans isomerase N-terminal domain-containing protein, partial [Candidatus Binatia bacterium]|nr:FKBP-type peptidyl-prolyl cis-trans isomerase N-terminal domain-containing protein [Candidatus Binatia bacterium]